MAQSMTGFASATGEDGPLSWNWDIRSVNARGLDLRLRVPDWISGLDEALRDAMKGQLARGNVTISLRVSRTDDAGQVAISSAGLSQALTLLDVISTEARAQGFDVAPLRAADVAAMRGVVDVKSSTVDDSAALLTILKGEIPGVIAQFVEARRREGAELIAILTRQVDEVAALVTQAEALLDARQEAQKTQLTESLARIMDNTEGVDADRLAQELALIAVKTDVREEVDRLRAHVTAARDHLASEAPIGRKLDFLMQEFNREANTLCSKAQFNALTTVGLDLKHVIDQMREQVQNLE